MNARNSVAPALFAALCFVASLAGCAQDRGASIPIGSRQAQQPLFRAYGQYDSTPIPTTSDTAAPSPSPVQTLYTCITMSNSERPVHGISVQPVVRRRNDSGSPAPSPSPSASCTAQYSNLVIYDVNHANQELSPSPPPSLIPYLPGEQVHLRVELNGAAPGSTPAPGQTPVPLSGPVQWTVQASPAAAAPALPGSQFAGTPLPEVIKGYTYPPLYTGTTFPTSPQTPYPNVSTMAPTDYTTADIEYYYRGQPTNTNVTVSFGSEPQQVAMVPLATISPTILTTTDTNPADVGVVRHSTPSHPEGVFGLWDSSLDGVTGGGPYGISWRYSVNNLPTGSAALFMTQLVQNCANQTYKDNSKLFEATNGYVLDTMTPYDEVYTPPVNAPGPFRSADGPGTFLGDTTGYVTRIETKSSFISFFQFQSQSTSISSIPVTVATEQWSFNAAADFAGKQQYQATGSPWKSEYSYPPTSPIASQSDTLPIWSAVELTNHVLPSVTSC